MDSTCLNITGFIQPAYVVKLLSQDDFDGFNDRQLYVWPAEARLTMTNLHHLILRHVQSWNASTK